MGRLASCCGASGWHQLLYVSAGELCCRCVPWGSGAEKYFAFGCIYYDVSAADRRADRALCFDRGSAWGTEAFIAAAAWGIRRFVYGLAKKILLADQLGEMCAVFRASEEKSVLFYWLYAVGCTLYIYFDFSGYSDMAVGLGRVFGFYFPENFCAPFLSTSMTEFWRRWHRSLGTWFRDYVYIPLGGNRCGRGRQILHIYFVWMLTGLWHGAEWNFVWWGLYFAVLLVFEKNCIRVFSGGVRRVVLRIYFLFFIVISFVLFHASDMEQAVSDIGGLFGAGGIPLVSQEALYCLRSYGVVMLAAAAGAGPVAAAAEKYRSVRTMDAEGRIWNAAEPVLILALFVVMTAYLADGSFQPFLYFRF